jgi:hypothetical protein
VRVNRGLSLITFFSIVITLFFTPLVNAVDLTNNISEIKNIGDWQLVEIIGGDQVGYRVATTSILKPNVTLVFDFLPSQNCLPSPALMIINFDSYTQSLDKGLVILEYKFPKEKLPTIEAINTSMSHGDSFAFFPFKTLTVDKFNNSLEKGKLAIWVSKGNDNEKSGSMFFSLDGFTSAYKNAKESCGENINK